MTSPFLPSLALTIAALCALLTSAQAQPVTTIFRLSDQSWQYYQEGTNPPPNNTAWKTNNYDDSAWQSGFGFFAYEPDTPGNYDPLNTVLTWSNFGAAEITRTFYFRTHFDFPTNPTNALLYFTNVVDDGGVVYLNGFEIYRLRVTGTPTYTTLASGGPATEGGHELVTIANSPRLRQGDNVIAVEVKQNAVTSSDVAWSMGLAYNFPEAIVITRQPPALTAAVAFDTLTLSVEATGSNPRYWWFRNNAFITGATNPVYTKATLTLGDAGTYHVVVSNTISGVRSSNAVVTVVPDTFGPRILYAYIAIGETNRLLLQLNEGTTTVHANTNFSSFNPTNYFVSILGRTNETNRIPITQVLPNNGQRIVRLTMSTNFNFATNYQICVKNIMDVRGNMIAWNSCVPVSIEAQTNIAAWRSPWFYNEWGMPLDDTNWTAVNYVEDFQWFETAGMFVNEQSGLVTPPCTSSAWTMSLGPNTYYFRKKFVLSTNVLVTNIVAILGRVIDDGAVFYLNGTEILRQNLPPGPITYNTRALAAGTPDICQTNEIIVGHLLGRTNVLAVEVHQFADSVTGADRKAAFDASLSLNYLRFPTFTQPTNVRVRITNHSPTQVSVYFTNGFGYALDKKTNLTDPWLEVQPVTNRLITPKTNPRQFYRLRKVH